jgi:hypothetical protein
MVLPYVVAALAAAAIIAAAFAYASHTRSAFVESLRQDLRDAKAAGTLPAEMQDVDIEKLDLADMGIEVTPGQMRRLSIADFIDEIWYLWAPMVLLVCFGIAAVFAQRRHGFK